jgi:PadR family transcriptional regulator PadR
MLNDYESTLLSGWEDLYKKAQLSVWILLALKDGPKQMADIKAFAKTVLQIQIATDDRSMHRSLRRLANAKIIAHATKPSQKGPNAKEYRLTETGQHVLQAFLARNIIAPFYNDRVRQLIQQ